jgi:hypothetical protein
LNVTVRGVDAEVFRRFKAKAAEEGMNLGEALTQAMEIWVKQRSAKPRARLLEINPFNWGRGLERASVEVDKISYGRSQ